MIDKLSIILLTLTFFLIGTVVGVQMYKKPTQNQGFGVGMLLAKNHGRR